jgi:flagellar motor switch protein FliG
MDEESFGLKEARNLLQGLRPNERKKILLDIQQKDPKLAKLLEKNLYQFDDLKYLTPKMLIELLRSISLEKFGLALKCASEELKLFVFSNVSSNMKKDLEEQIKGSLVPVSQVEAAMEEIMQVVVAKVERGELVLDSESSETIID